MGLGSTNRGLLRALLGAVLLAFALFVAYRFLSTVATVALSITAGVLLAVALSGPVEALHRRKLSRHLALALVVLAVLAVPILAGLLLVPLAADQLSQLLSSLPGAISELRGRVQGIAGRFGLSLPPGGSGGGSSGGSLSQVFGGAVGAFGGIVSAVGGLAVALFIGIYLAANPAPVVGWVVRLFPPGRRPRTREVLAHLRRRLLDWLKGQLTSMAVIGVLWTVALLVLGIPGAPLLGLFAGLVAFVPYLGPLIAVIPAFLLALVVSPLTALLVLAAYLVIQTAESYLITPLVMEEVASLHPATVIAAVAVLGTAFGIPGALLAVPTIVALGALVDELWFRRLETDGAEDTGKGG